MESCKQILVLLGPTYPTRLWCAWELLTLFAFTEFDLALQKVVLRTIDPEGNSSSMDALKTFDIRDAHCYDPNEEARLHTVVEGIGVDRFNGRIRALAEAIDSANEESSKQGIRHILSSSSNVILSSTSVLNMA